MVPVAPLRLPFLAGSVHNEPSPRRVDAPDTLRVCDPSGNQGGTSSGPPLGCRARLQGQYELDPGIAMRRQDPGRLQHIFIHSLANSKFVTSPPALSAMVACAAPSTLTNPPPCSPAFVRTA